MNTEKAIQILANVALLAQSKGILSLDDAVLVREAINMFKQSEESIPVTGSTPPPEDVPETE